MPSQSKVIGGRYELADLPAGRGGMGEVWFGRDVKLEREVAVKFVRFPDSAYDRELVRRFVRESRVTARLEHPGVPAIYDVGTHDEVPYLVMQRVRGTSVADILAEHGRLSIAWAAAIAAQVCSVLSVAHRASLVHRDLKPANLMLCADGTVKVLDFGLAVALDIPELSSITRTGESLGTPAYMAPEQVLAAMNSPQTDLYALGCTVHEMLAGRPPFSGSTAYAVMNRQVDEKPRSVRQTRPEVPDGLDELLIDLLQKRHEDRPSSADEVFDRLVPHLSAPGSLPGVVAGTSADEPVRRYAVAVARLTRGGQDDIEPARAKEPDLDTEVSGSAAVEPSVPAAPSALGRGDLARARQEADSLVQQSRYSQAAEILAAAAEPASRVFGPDDTDVLSLRHDLANILLEGGDFRRAAPLYGALAADFAGRHGPDAEVVFTCRLQASTCHALIGDATLALRELGDLLEDERRVYGDDDLRTLELRRQIGLLQLGSGRVDAARQTLDGLLNDLARAHAIEHPMAAKVREVLSGLDRARRG